MARHLDLAGMRAWSVRARPQAPTTPTTPAPTTPLVGDAGDAAFVTSFLYFFKPPFPSDGGCAAASAGGRGLSAPPVEGAFVDPPSRPNRLAFVGRRSRFLGL